jgi:hypothetical protein
MVAFCGIFDFLATQKTEVRVTEVASHVITTTPKSERVLTLRTDLVVLTASLILERLKKTRLVDGRHLRGLQLHGRDQLW